MCVRVCVCGRLIAKNSSENGQNKLTISVGLGLIQSSTSRVLLGDLAESMLA